MGKFIDITGQRFGKLTAVEYRGNSRWDCVCDCGKTTVVRAACLKNGNTKSCGCGHYGYSDPNDYVGMRFGELIVEEIIHKGSYLKCKCVCSCGNQTVTSLFQLRRGIVVSCGCYKRRIASNRMKKYNSTNNPNSIRRSYYEKMNGVLSKDEYVISLDGNPLNLTDENLMAIHKRTYNNLSSHRLLGCGELTRTAVLIDELEHKLNKFTSQEETV